MAELITATDELGNTFKLTREEAKALGLKVADEKQAKPAATKKRAAPNKAKK